VRVDSRGRPGDCCRSTSTITAPAAEGALRRSEALLSHLVATSPDVITLTEFDSGRYAMVNDCFCRWPATAATR
jgi:hypothetical protein